MKKAGCVLGGVAWLALMAGYAYVARKLVPAPGAIALIAFFGGTFALILGSAFVGLFTKVARPKNAVNTPVKNFVVALALFLALHAMLAPVYLFAPKRDSKGELLPKNPSVLDERDCARQKELLDAGANPNERNRDGETPLMNAARLSPVSCIRNLVRAGARLEDVDHHGDTALAQALTADRDEAAQVLRDAGAKDFRVTAASGRAMTRESEPFGVVREFASAVHRGDFDTMARLMPGSFSRLMRKRQEDLALWQAMRPKDPMLVDGWMNDDAATLRVRGRVPAGEATVSYHLEKTFEGWRIFREWFPAPGTHRDAALR